MPKADLGRAQELYPSTQMGADGWMEFFDSREGRRAMGRILYDVYDQIKEDEERREGRRRVGRRPGREAVPLDEVYKTIFPAPPSNEVFQIAVRNLMGSMSGRALAGRIGMSVQQCHRYLTGTLQPDLYVMERIAEVFKVHPSHFMEWRAQYISSVIQAAYIQNPNLSISAYRAIRNGNRNHLLEGRV